MIRAMFGLKSVLSLSFALFLVLPSPACRILLAAAQEVRVGTWKTAQTIQPFLYDRFHPSGTDTRISVFSFTNPADQKTALLAGDLDMCGTTLVHAIQSAAKGQPVVMVAALCNKCSALVVRNDGSFSDVSGLKGKRIGYVPGTMHEVLLREILTRNGISPEKDATLIRVDFFDMGAALAARSIDAFLSGEPLPTQAVERGYGKVLAYPYFDESIGTINAGLIVQQRTIERNPELVHNLVLAHARATRRLTEHPDEWLKKAAEFGTPLSTLEKAAHNMELSWEMDEAFVGRARALGERMQALGLIHRQPDYDRLFDLSFVKRVKAQLGEPEGAGADK